MSSVTTFYSYKGGTGRTMALANTGVILAREASGRVLMVDWDLEAPGLHSFFPEVEPKISEGEVLPAGLLELFERADLASRKQSLDETDAIEFWQGTDWQRMIVPTDEPELHLLRAGRFDATYGTRVNALPWRDLFERSPGIFKAFVDTLASSYRYVLIDSRTGLNDASGICTMLLPDRLVVVFTPNRQSLTGVVDLVQRATDYRSESADVRPLLVFPLASRVELSEDELRREWRYGGRNAEGYQPQFERLFERIYRLRNCRLEHYFDEIQIQHVTSYAYGEKVAIRDEDEKDRLSLSRSYERFVWALSGSDGPWTFERDPKPTGEDEKQREFVIDRALKYQEVHEERAIATKMTSSFLLILIIVGILGAAGLFAFGPPFIGTSRVRILTWACIPLILAGAMGVLRRRSEFRRRYKIHMRAANAIERQLSLFEGGAMPYGDAENPAPLLVRHLEEIDAGAEDELFDFDRSLPSHRD